MPLNAWRRHPSVDDKTKLASFVRTSAYFLAPKSRLQPLASVNRSRLVPFGRCMVEFLLLPLLPLFGIPPYFLIPPAMISRSPSELLHSAASARAKVADHGKRMPTKNPPNNQRQDERFGLNESPDPGRWQRCVYLATEEQH
jgi:hypothetical protein